MTTYYVLHTGIEPRMDNTVFVGTLHEFDDVFGITAGEMTEKHIIDFAKSSASGFGPAYNVTKQNHIWLTDEVESPDYKA